MLLLRQLLLDHQDAIAPEHNDALHELLEDLGEVPTVESLIGGCREKPAGQEVNKADPELGSTFNLCRALKWQTFLFLIIKSLQAC